MENIIETINICKSFKSKEKGEKKIIQAVKNVCLDVRKNEIFGFLGPNGAGKTTTLRMLTTLLPIEEGEAFLCGYNIKKEAHKVRRCIGYISQLGGGDPLATGRENLMLSGQLYGMSHNETSKRTDALIDMFDLGEIKNRKVQTYSGGQKRRLELAIGMIHKPQVLFLDEPTTGLDPQNRANLWEQIRNLRNEGVTIFLTTHYLDEADKLADRISIMDNGMIVATGTPNELKHQIAGDVITIRLKENNTNKEELSQLFSSIDNLNEIRTEGDSFYLYIKDGSKEMQKILSILENKNLYIETMSLSQPSLDDVFLKQTGRLLRDIGKEE